MRSVNTRKPARNARGKGRRTLARESWRGGNGRSASGRKDDSRENPLAHFVRNVREKINFRRPMIWLTVSVLCVTVLAGLLAGGYVQRSFAAVGRSIDGTAIAAGYGVSRIEISGESRTTETDILQAMSVKKGQSLFSVDAQRTRENLRALPWIADAVVHKHYPGTLAIAVTEKTPFALWLSDESKLYVIERSGAIIAETDGAEFAKLPHFVGDPPQGAAELVDAIAAHRAVSARVRAMQRISGRRWNLLLDGGVLVDLPEENWRQELDNLEHLIVDRGVLERAIREIDLRAPGNYVFIMRGGATERAPKGNAA
jgi:cell division protein FtsQ